jgi:uncharacterized protein (DUF2384 family)
MLIHQPNHLFLNAIKEFRKLWNLASSVLPEEEVYKWMVTPNAVLDNRSPIQAMQENNTYQIIDLLYEMRQ